MAGPHKITDLEIVGYATVLPDTMLPSVAPPIFRLRNQPDRILFPPFTLAAGMVFNATEGSPSDFDELKAKNEITRLQERLDAKPDFELWIDQERSPRYEPRSKAHETLHRIAEISIEEARKAFASRDYKQAGRLCGIALSADDRLVDSLVIKAAIHSMQNDSTGVSVMEELASISMCASTFRRNVQDLVDSVGKVIESQSQDLFTERPMFEMAQKAA